MDGHNPSSSDSPEPPSRPARRRLRFPLSARPVAGERGLVRISLTTIAAGLVLALIAIFISSVSTPELGLGVRNVAADPDDLEVEVASGTHSPQLREYTLRARNNGVPLPGSIVVRDNLDDNLVILAIHSVADGWSCSQQAGNVVQCSRTGWGTENGFVTIAQYDVCDTIDRASVDHNDVTIAYEGTVQDTAGDTSNPNVFLCNHDGQLTVKKVYVGDDGPPVDVTVTCTGGDPSDNGKGSADTGSPAVFDVTDITDSASCDAVEDDEPAGYTETDNTCNDVVLDANNRYTAECTITNTQDATPTGTITVTKICDPVGAGTFTITLWNTNGTPDTGNDTVAGSIQTNCRNNPPATFTNLPLGTYYATENIDSGDWQQVDTTCDSLVLSARVLSATCSITNDPAAQPTGAVIVNKVCDPADVDASFEITLYDANRQVVGTATIYCRDNPDTTRVVEPTQVVFPNLPGGLYTVVETTPAAPWINVSNDCTHDNLNLTPPQVTRVTCTITNTQSTGAVIVNKVCNPAGAAGTFTVTLYESTDAARANPLASDTVDCANDPQAVFLGLAAGSYDVVETGNAGWTVDNTCANLTVSPPGVTRASCTITNSMQTLTVNKVCLNTTNGTFDLLVDTAPFGTGDNVGCGGTTGAVPIATGNHTVTENIDSGGPFTTTFGGDCNAAGIVNVAAGDNAVCTVTNAVQTLTVNKVCVNTTTGTFDLRVDNAAFGTGENVGCGGTTGAVSVTTGNHTVTENIDSGGPFTTTFGGDCNAAGNVNVAAGDNAVCTVTNAVQTLTVNKVCLNTTTGQFDLRIDGVIVGTGANVGCGGTTGAVNVTAGLHNVSEIVDSGGPFNVSFGGACNAAGNVNVAAGTDVVCTVINDPGTTTTIVTFNTPTPTATTILEVQGVVVTPTPTPTTTLVAEEAGVVVTPTPTLIAEVEQVRALPNTGTGGYLQGQDGVPAWLPIAFLAAAVSVLAATLAYWRWRAAGTR